MVLMHGSEAGCSEALGPRLPPPKLLLSPYQRKGALALQDFRNLFMISNSPFWMPGAVQCLVIRVEETVTRKQKGRPQKTLAKGCGSKVGRQQEPRVQQGTTSKRGSDCLVVSAKVGLLLLFGLFGRFGTRCLRCWSLRCWGLLLFGQQRCLARHVQPCDRIEDSGSDSGPHSSRVYQVYFCTRGAGYPSKYIEYSTLT